MGAGSEATKSTAVGCSQVLGAIVLLAWFGTTVRHLEAYWQQYKTIMEGGQVAKPIKEIIAMVVSALNNCAP